MLVAFLERFSFQQGGGEAGWWQQQSPRHLHDLRAPAAAAHGPYLNALVFLGADVVRGCLGTPTAQVPIHLQDG